MMSKNHDPLKMLRNKKLYATLVVSLLATLASTCLSDFVLIGRARRLHHGRSVSCRHRINNNDCNHRDSLHSYWNSRVMSQNYKWSHAPRFKRCKDCNLTRSLQLLSQVFRASFNMCKVWIGRLIRRLHAHHWAICLIGVTRGENSRGISRKKG